MRKSLLHHCDRLESCPQDGGLRRTVAGKLAFWILARKCQVNSYEKWNMLTPTRGNYHQQGLEFRGTFRGMADVLASFRLSWSWDEVKT